MKNKKGVELDFIVDKLTNSIENVVTGDRFQTEISMLNSEDLKPILNINTLKTHIMTMFINLINNLLNFLYFIPLHIYKFDKKFE